MPENFNGQRLDLMPFGYYNNNNQGRIKDPMPYPSPFFDLSKFFLPRSVKELFKWCRFYFKTDGLIHSTVYKMSEYPVTDLIFEIPEEFSEEDGTKKLKKALEEDFALKSELIKIGLDYYTYGNALVSIYFPFKRMLECPHCHSKHQLEDFKKFDKKGDLWFKKYRFHGDCPKCHVKTDFNIKDLPVKNSKKIKLIRFNPEHFDVEYNEITGESKYYYQIPNKIKQKIISCDLDTLMTAPKLYFDALKENKAVQISNSNIFHFKREDIADNDMEWGMPLILPAMRNLFHLAVLRKAQQAIAMEHLVPLRILYPTDNQTMTAAPHLVEGLGNWKMRVEMEVKKWKQDPNYMPIMPIPLGMQAISGDGKMLLLTQEMRMIAEEIINGMGVPQEFVFGGLSWSGSSISLRMLENHFLFYRKQLLEFLEKFIVKKIAAFLNVKPIRIKMQEFKMADDIQRKQLLQELNQANKISDTTFLKEVAGLDASAEIQQMIADYKKKIELFELIGKQQGLIQAAIAELTAKAQAKAQQEMFDAQQRNANQNPPANTHGLWKEVLQMLHQEQAIQEAEQNAIQQSGGPEVMAQQDPQVMASRYAEELASFPPEKQQQIISRLKEEMPQMAELIIQKFMEIKQGSQQIAANASIQMQDQPQAQSRVDMRPNSEKLPPRREGRSI